MTFDKLSEDMPPARGHVESDGERRKITKTLNQLVVIRLREAYRAHPTKNLPSKLKPNSKHELAVGAIETRYDDLGKTHQPDTDPAALLRWRTQYEAGDGGAGPSEVDVNVTPPSAGHTGLKRSFIQAFWVECKDDRLIPFPSPPPFPPSGKRGGRPELCIFGISRDEGKNSKSKKIRVMSVW